MIPLLAAPPPPSPAHTIQVPPAPAVAATRVSFSGDAQSRQLSRRERRAWRAAVNRRLRRQLFTKKHRRAAPLLAATKLA